MTEFEGTTVDAPGLSIHEQRKLRRDENALFPRSDVLMEVDWEPELKKPKGDELRMVVNQDRIDEVLGALMDAYNNNEYPYNLDSTRVPQDPRHMPPSLELGSVDHAMFFWNLCYYMRGGTESTTAVKYLATMYEDRPDLFNCEGIINSSPEDIERELKIHGLGMQHDNSLLWHRNAGRMLELYDGDPRKIFEGASDYEVVLKRIANRGKTGFAGFQKKMTSMIAYYLMDQELIEHHTYPLPVDIHVSRVMLETKMVEFPDAPFGTNLYGEEVLDLMRDVSYRYAVDNDIDWLRLCDAVWLLSQALCSDAPGNQSSEPLGIENRNGRSTPLRPVPVDIYSPAQQRAYERTCRPCPVQEYCAFNVLGGKMYNVLGGLMIRQLRREFPVIPPPPEPTSEPAPLF